MNENLSAFLGLCVFALIALGPLLTTMRPERLDRKKGGRG